MSGRGSHKLPVKRLTDEELAARDFILDFMMEDGFSDFMYTAGGRTLMCGSGNKEYLDMVINGKRGWVIEVERCNSETRPEDKSSVGLKGVKKGR